ncbi:MAG: APC family permease [Sphingomonadaceae bacterium]|nr:APC family permease [Sphingomonadaceae bacterium]
MQTDNNESAPTLRRALTLPLLTLYGLGVTIGAGIYVLVGTTAAEAGKYAPVSFLIAAVVVAFTAFSYVELITRFPVSAGEAAFVEAGFRKRWLTVTVGLLVALSGIVSASAIAIGAASYLTGITGLPVPALTIGTVLAMGLLAAWGIAESVMVAAIVTVIEIGGLLLVIFWGFGDASGTALAVSELIPPLQGAHWQGIGAASLLAFFAFVGFEDMANVAEEVKDPVRTFPRAIFLTLIAATLLYLITTSAVIVSVPLDKLAGTAAPLALVFANAPQSVSDAFSVIAVVATVNGILIQMIMASRVFFGLASRGYLPRQLAWVSARTRTPLVATALVAAAIVILTQAFPIEQLAERTSQIVLGIFVLVNLALLRLKLREPMQANNHFSVPIAIPILGVLTSVALLTTALL